MNTFWQATEAIGGLLLVVVAATLAVVMVYHSRTFRDMIRAFNSLREGFQLHAGHCHIIKDTDRLLGDMRTAIAVIESIDDPENAGETRELLIRSLIEKDAPRLRQWVQVLAGERAHADGPSEPR